MTKKEEFKGDISSLIREAMGSESPIMKYAYKVCSGDPDAYSVWAKSHFSIPEGRFHPFDLTTMDSDALERYERRSKIANATTDDSGIAAFSWAEACRVQIERNRRKSLSQSRRSETHAPKLSAESMNKDQRRINFARYSAYSSYAELFWGRRFASPEIYRRHINPENIYRENALQMHSPGRIQSSPGMALGDMILEKMYGLARDASLKASYAVFSDDKTQKSEKEKEIMPQAEFKIALTANKAAVIQIFSGEDEKADDPTLYRITMSTYTEESEYDQATGEIVSQKNYSPSRATPIGYLEENQIRGIAQGILAMLGTQTDE